MEKSDKDKIKNKYDSICFSDSIIMTIRKKKAINRKSITFSTKMQGNNLFFFILSFNEIKTALIASPNLVGKITL